MYYHIPKEVFFFSYLECYFYVMIYFTYKLYSAHYIRSHRYFMMIFRSWASEAAFALSKSMFQVDCCSISTFICYSWWIPADRLYLRSNFLEVWLNRWSRIDDWSFICLVRVQKGTWVLFSSPSLSLQSLSNDPAELLGFGLHSWVCKCWELWGWGSFCSPSHWKKLKLEGVKNETWRY